MLQTPRREWADNNIRKFLNWVHDRRDLSSISSRSGKNRFRTGVGSFKTAAAVESTQSSHLFIVLQERWPWAGLRYARRCDSEKGDEPFACRLSRRCLRDSFCGEGGMDPRIQRFLRLLNKSYGQSWCLSGLAREMKLSGSHFRHPFRREVGVSLIEPHLLVRRRLGVFLIPSVHC